MMGGGGDTHRHQSDLIRLSSLFQNRESIGSARNVCNRKEVFVSSAGNSFFNISADGLDQIRGIPNNRRGN